MADRNEYELPAVETGQRMGGTNLSASPTSCATCQGDRFVIVAGRTPKASSWMKERDMEPPKGWQTTEGFVPNVIEEVAPCPDCNPQVIQHYRADGTLIKTPDPAKVRELLSR